MKTDLAGVARRGGSRKARGAFWFWLPGLAMLLRADPGSEPVRAERSEPASRSASEAAAPAVPAAAVPTRPNLLILVADDHRAGTLGVDGDPRRATPRLDGLARQGVRFSRAYCNAPLCTPSRQSFITGRLPHAVGVTRLTTPLPETAVTLGDWLGRRGYDTAAIGKMHFNDRSHHGFRDRVDLREWEGWLRANPPPGGDRRRRWRPFQDPASVWLNADCRPEGLPSAAMDATFFADAAIAYLRVRRPAPFALVASFYEPHSPFTFPQEWAGRYAPETFAVPPVSAADLRARPRVFRALSERDARGIQAAYFTSLSFLDHQVGRVLDALDAQGLAENTVVVYLGDNGYMLGEHGRFEKHCFYEPAVRVPLLVRWPGRIPADRRVDEMAELVDLFPTLLDLLGVDAPSGLHGRSLVPLLKGERSAVGRDVVFSEYLENEEAMVRTARHKLIVGTGRRRRRDGYDNGLPPTGRYEHLYDLEADPGETADLAARPDLAALKAELLRRLYLRLTTTRDSVVPVPPGLAPREAIDWCLVSRDSDSARSR